MWYQHPGEINDWKYFVLKGDKKTGKKCIFWKIHYNNTAMEKQTAVSPYILSEQLLLNLFSCSMLPIQLSHVSPDSAVGQEANCSRYSARRSLAVASSITRRSSCHCSSHWLMKCGHYPSNRIHWANVGLMLGQRRRRWPNIKPALAQCIVFAR